MTLDLATLKEIRRRANTQYQAAEDRFAQEDADFWNKVVIWLDNLIGDNL